MSKKIRAQGILWESPDDGVCAKPGLSISDTEKEREPCDVRLYPEFRQVQSQSARSLGLHWAPNYAAKTHQGILKRALRTRRRLGEIKDTARILMSDMTYDFIARTSGQKLWRGEAY
jgi:hypothetical protein